MTESSGGGQSGNRFESFGKRLDQHLGSAEEEMKRVIAYLNDEVVPRLRGGSAQALHTAAERLRKFADYLDDNDPAGPSGER